MKGVFGFISGVITVVANVLFAIIPGIPLLFLWSYLSFFHEAQNLDRAPLALPLASYTAEESKAAVSEWNDFVQSVVAGKGTAITLDTKRLQILIASESRGRGASFLRAVMPIIENGEMRFVFSLPLDRIGIAGRYLNGETKATFALEHDVLSVRVRELKLPRGILPTPMLAIVPYLDFSFVFRRLPPLFETIRQRGRVAIEGERLNIVVGDGAPTAIDHSDPSGFNVHEKKLTDGHY